MPYRVTTVCTGNICRSPMAEAVLRDRFASAGLGDAVVVDSSGASDEETGNPIDPRAADVLREAGYALPDHRAHQVTAGELASRDLVLPMTEAHARALRRLAPERADRVRMFRSFDPAADGADLDVADPWYGGRDDFVTVLAQVEAAAEGIVAHVRRELEGRSAR